MQEFLSTAFGFPTVVFGVPLVLVVGFWLVVALGGTDADALETDALETDAAGLGGLLSSLGLGGIPATISASVFVALSWFASLAASSLVDGITTDATKIAAGVGTLVVAVLVGWLGTVLAVRPLRRVFAEGRPASRADFVGRVCVIRTGRVDVDFGQAEVTAADGSTAIVQVRQTGADSFAAGSLAAIYSYDEDGEFFWIVPITGAGGAAKAHPV
ncbi:hypothetical protein [Pseudonocardia sp. TRM90224]|uniref:hypothetical protein n=1 Tax=Pseudonocardia sp. TRM90224 TaxID=2812678 RepID=UPI001E4D62FC|nr:hypothetical protein [Pseudonocardia sp. TRM90224]